MKKKLFTLVLSAASIGLLCTGCSKQKQETAETEAVTETEMETEAVTETEALEASESDSALTIVYTNDVHSYIANEKEKAEGAPEDAPAEDGLRFSKVSQMVKDMRAEGREVILVDAGDEVQGSSYGAIDEGESIIEIMNAAGYQLATLGNHEFDYGANTLFKRAEEAEFSYISCNFHTIEDSATSDPFEAAKIFECGDVTVAFVGITTPDTISASTPIYFQDAEGNYIYDIDGIGDANNLYESVQQAIDSVKDQVDYVIALGHTGVGSDEQSRGIASINIIENTSGLDAYIDGHSHTTMEGDIVIDKDGNEVILTQTGSYLNAIGVLEISEDGKITTSLVTDYDGEDPDVAAVEDKLIEKVKEELGQQIATLDTELYIANPEDEGQRLVRARELNSGDIVADAFYWYFNEEKQMDCDVAFINGGGVRSNIKAGAVTLNDAKNVQPFGNMVCLINATGQEIKDALEMGVTVVELWDDEWNSPAENGSFKHVAGIKYSVDTSIPSSVVLDENEMFVSVDGEYRVKDIEVYNKETGSYEPLDTEKTYTLGSINYLLRNGGSGLSMLMDNEMIIDYVGQDCDILAAYFESFTADGEYPRINTENSPLAAYEGYLLDYENPYGSGRINLIGIE